MPNIRPDQAKFDSFVAHFDEIDNKLEAFCKANDFKLVKNQHRQPCRVLRNGDNPIAIIEINLVENWQHIDFADNLTHAMGVCAYYVPPEDKAYIWKLSESLAENATFELIKRNLQVNLSAALDILTGWTPLVILDKGKRLENLSEKFGGV